LHPHYGKSRPRRSHQPALCGRVLVAGDKPRPRHQESKERSMIYRRSRGSRVVGVALAALGLVLGGCADKVAARSSSGAGVTTTDGGGRQGALGTGGDERGGTAGSSGTGGSSAGARDATVEANSQF